MKTIINYFTNYFSFQKKMERKKKKGYFLELIKAFLQERDSLIKLKEKWLKEGWDASVVAKEIKMPKRICLLECPYDIFSKDDFRALLKLVSNEDIDEKLIGLGDNEDIYKMFRGKNEMFEPEGFWVYKNYALDISSQSLFYYYEPMRRETCCTIPIGKYECGPEVYHYHLIVEIDEAGELKDKICLNEVVAEVRVYYDGRVFHVKFFPEKLSEKTLKVYTGVVTLATVRYDVLRCLK